MAGFIGGTPVSLTGTTWVTVVAAPAASKQRQILGIHVNNLDTATRVIKLRKLVAAAGYEDYPPVTIASTKRAQVLLESVVLDATNMSFQLSTDATAATTEPRVDVSVFEVP